MNLLIHVIINGEQIGGGEKHPEKAGNVSLQLLINLNEAELNNCLGATMLRKHCLAASLPTHNVTRVFVALCAIQGP